MVPFHSPSSSERQLSGFTSSTAHLLPHQSIPTILYPIVCAAWEEPDEFGPNGTMFFDCFHNSFVLLERPIRLIQVGCKVVHVTISALFACPARDVGCNGRCPSVWTKHLNAAQQQLIVFC
mmetsp:Transcript_44743/g.117340  ORF Transcript_44743/g.117340 Transcript_44743/m.117340 type:complete len:121 (-) Transcript_44743:151-513(-)